MENCVYHTYSMVVMERWCHHLAAHFLGPGKLTSCIRAGGISIYLLIKYQTYENVQNATNC